MPPEQRRLVVDEQLSPRLARELLLRGFEGATSCQWLGQRGVDDEPWLTWLAENVPGCVLITWDNDMPYNHRDLLQDLGTTLAVVDSEADWGGLGQEAYKRDVVHRWAHRIAYQRAGLVASYSRLGWRALNLAALPATRRRRR